MSHANAALTPKHRLKVARLVVDHGHSISEIAARFQCSRTTVKRCQRSLKSSPKRSSKCSPIEKDGMGDFFGPMGTNPLPAWATPVSL